MRLLEYGQDRQVTLTRDLLDEDAIPPYAILSHTWGDEEVDFEEITTGRGKTKSGYEKIRFCMDRAAEDGIHHSWVDTCCINKTDNTELQHAINSMFRWYKNSVVCYVFMTDVSTSKRKADSETCEHSWELAFRGSRWFTRGWTLQELLAPRNLQFFSKETKFLGSMHHLIDLVHRVTNLPIAVLKGSSLDRFSIEERLNWTKDRTTTRIEDKAYSLLGIFGIFMPLIYGEGETNAFRRLRKEIQERVCADQGRGGLVKTHVPPLSAFLGLSELELGCLQSLAYREQERRHIDIHRAVETCDWLLQDLQFTHWTKSLQGLLWIKGDPGSGKSVLMKHAVKSMMLSHPEELIVSYFIHGQGSELQRTSTGVYRALLNSLLGHFPTYLSKLAATFGEREERYGAYSSDRWAWASTELQDLLEDLLINHTQEQQVTIFVDALDECGERAARSLMAYFCRLTKKASDRQAQVRFCLSSRHYPVIALDDYPSIFVDDRNKKDIEWFINSRLETIESSQRQQVLNEIMSKAQGSFQWVLLVTDLVIDRTYHGKNVLGQIASCPSTLGDMYASLLNAASDKDKRQSVKLFRWIIFARRPLSTQELREALATDVDMSFSSVAEMRKHGEWSETLGEFERYITFISKGLVKFKGREIWESWEESDHEAQLIHQSVADFLLDGFLVDGDQNSACAGHYLISRSCLKYLTLRDIPGKCQQQRDRMSSEFPLGPYAVRYVFDHIRSVEEAGLIQSDLLSVLKWSPWSETMSQLAIVWKILNPNSLGTPSGWPFIRSSELHVLAALGSHSAFLVSLQKDPGALHRRDVDGNTPLHIALNEGQTGVISLLLNKHSQWKDLSRNRGNDVLCPNTWSSSQVAQPLDLDARNEEGDTPLDVATTMMANTALLSLLCSGAAIERMNQPRLLLVYAIDSGDVVLLQKLITSHADLTGSLYHAVTHDSSLDIFQELLEAYTLNERLDIDEIIGSPNYRYRTALHLACSSGLKQKVNLLLMHGASATACNESGECPLRAAVTTDDVYYEERHGDFVDIIKALLRHAPSTVELKRRHDGSTALDDAIRLLRKPFIRILLKEGEFSNPSSTLTRMFVNGDVLDDLCHKLEIEDPGELGSLMRMVEKIDPYLRDEQDRTALWNAAANGRKAIAQHLIKRAPLHVNTVDEDGISPLHIALQLGHLNVAEILLSVPCVDINAVNGLLHWAITNENTAMAQFLLSAKSINANAINANGATPLLAAIRNGHIDIAITLLQRKDILIRAHDEPEVSPIATALRACQMDTSGQSLSLLKETSSGQYSLASFYTELVERNIHPALTLAVLRDSHFRDDRMMTKVAWNPYLPGHI